MKTQVTEQKLWTVTQEIRLNYTVAPPGPEIWSVF